MKIAVCDDEKISLEAVVTYIEDYCAERKSSLEYECFTNYPDLEPRIDEFDFFVMDYQTPEIDGLTFARKIREVHGEQKAIIFVTSFSEIVYDSFEVRTHRFLVKPLDKMKFFEAIDSFMSTNMCNPRIAIKSDGETDVLNISDILYVEVDDKETVFYTAENQYISRMTISSVESELIPHGFFRVHRSFLINMKKISRFDKTSVMFENGESVPISKRNYSEFCKKYLNE